MRRHDGRKIKTISPFNKIIPYILSKRSDAEIYAKQIVCTEPIDTYIHAKREQNIEVSYLHLFIAVYLRVIALRPRLNRFVMNSQYYARKGISISLVIKHSLHDDGEETTVKFNFTGRENIFEIIEIVNRVISDASKEEGNAGVDKLIDIIMSMPGVFKKVLVGIIKSMDVHNLIPRSIIDVSPFHSTLFLTYLKSIKTGYVYHHHFNIGTAGIFVALGKVEKLPVVEKDTIVIRKCCEIGYTIDDRICDGLYLANSFKLVKRYLNNPVLLETGLEEIVEDAK